MTEREPNRALVLVVDAFRRFMVYSSFSTPGNGLLRQLWLAGGRSAENAERGFATVPSNTADCRLYLGNAAKAGAIMGLGRGSATRPPRTTVSYLWILPPSGKFHDDRLAHEWLRPDRQSRQLSQVMLLGLAVFLPRKGAPHGPVLRQPAFSSDR